MANATASNQANLTTFMTANETGDTAESPTPTTEEIESAAEPAAPIVPGKLSDTRSVSRVVVRPLRAVDDLC